MISVILSAVLGYFLGAVPFGVILTKFAGLGDIRAVGSGNIGATNVLRTGRKDIALATLLLDGGKGAAAIFIAAALGWRPEIAGAAAMLGHCFPVWLGFRGGKGVATFLGSLLALWFPAGLFACITWLGAAFITRLSSLSALIAAAAAPLILFTMGRPFFAMAAAFMAVIIFVRHRPNIERLLSGTEPRIGAGKKKAATQAPAPDSAAPTRQDNPTEPANAEHASPAPPAAAAAPAGQASTTPTPSERHEPPA